MCYATEPWLRPLPWANVEAEFMPGTITPTAARLYSGLRLARLHPPVFNLVISNIPGPPIDLYCVRGTARCDCTPTVGPVSSKRRAAHPVTLSCISVARY